MKKELKMWNTVIITLFVSLAAPIHADSPSNITMERSVRRLERVTDEDSLHTGHRENFAKTLKCGDDFADGKNAQNLNEEKAKDNLFQARSNTVDAVNVGFKEPEIRDPVGVNLIRTTLYDLVNVLEPPPTQPTTSVQRENPAAVALFKQVPDEDDAKENLRKAAERGDEIKRVEHPRELDWRPNYQLVSTAVNESINSSESIMSFRTLLLTNSTQEDHDSERVLERAPRGYESSISNPSIPYEPVPFAEPYEMPQLGLTDGIFVFTYLGEFLSFIQPYDFPVEFLRDALWNKVSVINLIFQSLRFEGGFITLVVVGLLLSLIIPAFAVASSCSSICVPDKKKMSESASTLSLDSINWSRRTQVFTLFVIISLVGSGVVAMIVTNEQLSSAMLRSPQVLSAALNDAGTYIRNTHRHISHVTITALDRTLTYFYRDLEEVEELLGKPIQSQVAAETGIDVALDALVDVATVSDGLSAKVAELQDTNLKMRGLMSDARDRLADLRGQVDALRRACPSRDRPLCDTIESSGLSLSLKTDQLNTDPRLAILRSMAGGNLPLLAERMRAKFADIPLDIARATRDIRADLRRELDDERERLDSVMWPVESLTRDLRSRINGARDVAQIVEDLANGVEQWRWLSFLSVSLLVLLIWLLLTTALIYSCCDRIGSAKSLLIGALVLSSMLSIFLWAIALSIMLVGGHGEVFVCRPLYDQPDFKSLTELLDDPGVLYERGGGFFKNIVPRNYTLLVPVRTVLQECENNRPAYEAFGLKSIINVDASSDFRSWGNVLNQISNLNGNFTELHFLDPELQEKLHSLLQATAVNMTAHRAQISRPITDKDLSSFAKQLDSVANQIKDLSTASRVEALASRTRRLITGNIQPLEGKKEELVYQVTALEVLIAPLQRQVNQSLSHLKTIQYYIDNQASNISQMKASDYSQRLTSYLNQYREQLLSNMRHGVGLCRPVFDLYHGVRHHMCRQIMDPLNGYWFALVWCLLSLVIATPVCLKLIHYYGLHKDGLLDNSGSSLSSVGRGSAWTTPGDERSIDNSNW